MHLYIFTNISFQILGMPRNTGAYPTSAHAWQQLRAACSDHLLALLLRRLFSFPRPRPPFSPSLFVVKRAPVPACLRGIWARSLLPCQVFSCMFHHVKSPMDRRRRAAEEDIHGDSLLDASVERLLFTSLYIYMKGARPDDTLQRHGS